MSNVTFGNFIRQRREKKELPLQKVAAYLDIDSSTLSKFERGEKPASREYLKPLSETLELELKQVQTTYIADKITKNFVGLEYLSEGLK